MEAILKKKRVIYTKVFTIGDNELQLDYYFKSLIDADSFNPDLLIINYDRELTDDVIKSVISGYSNTYQVLHSFKTDKLYLSDITQYMKDIFNIEGGKNA